MANSVALKLKIKEGMHLLTVHAPANFEAHLQPLPNGVIISNTIKLFDQIHWFVTNKQQLENEGDKIIKLVKGNVVCWIYYPKGTSKIQTDLTRDKGWDALLKHENMQWLTLISFDETWSAFGFRLKTNADEKKEAAPKAREILNYIDAEKKIVNLPDDVADAFKASKQAKEFFGKLSFSNKKEYVEWIVTARREETRTERIKGTVERLEKGWKNPRNI